MRTALVRATALVLLAVAGAQPARAQCSTWTPGWASPALPNGANPPFLPFNGRSASAVYFDGPESHLFATREFGNFDHEIWRWSGTRWDPAFVLATPGSTFGALFPIDDAGTPLLLATFQSASASPTMTAMWAFNGSTWMPKGALALRVYAAGSFDDGTGSAPIAAGDVPSLVPPGAVARWNGSSWIEYPRLVREVHSLAGFDDGTGVRLCAASYSQLVNGSRIVAWNGTAWDAVGTGQPECYAIAGFQGALYGAFNTNPPSDTLQRFAGGVWSVLPTQAGYVLNVQVVDFGGGPRLAVCGTLGVHLFDGTNFTEPGGHVYGYATGVFVTTAGGVPKLHASGQLTTPAGVNLCTLPDGIAFTDGTTWSALGLGVDAPVRAFARHDFGAGEELVALGDFRNAGFGTGTFNGLGVWNGVQWRALAVPSSHGNFTLAGLDRGAGSELFLGGSWMLNEPYRGVARWNGASWQAFANEIGGDVHVLAVHATPAGPRLIAGGNFLQATRGAGSNISLLNGTTWTPMGSGTNGIVATLASFTESTGTHLFAGGAFTTAGGVATGAIARWNGAAWSALGSGITGGVNALCVFDAGNGPALYAGGTFTNAGGVAVNNVARWNGAGWSALPGFGPNGVVLSLHVHDDGRGPALYVGGGFTAIGTQSFYNVARFDGAGWEAVDGGLDGAVNALFSIDDDGDGDRELFAGGKFENAAAFASGHIARLGGCHAPIEAFCFGDGSLTDHTTPCPCANDGAAGHGCANSFVSAGAQLGASGTTLPDTLMLTAADQPQSSFGIFLQHDALDDRVFHDGVLCGGGTMIRLRTRTAVGGVTEFPNSSDTITLSQRGQVLPGSGATRYYSLFYRNASTTFCPPATANGTNGVRVRW